MPSRDRLQQIKSHLTMSTSEPEFLEEHIFFGHDAVNRVSFLREDNDFITAALTHPSTKIAIFWNDAPIGKFIVDGETKTGVQLHYTNYEEIKPQADEFLKFNSEKSAKVNDLRFLFLGIDERSKEPNVLEYKKYKGLAYFGVDISTHLALQELFSLKFIEKNDNTTINIISKRDEIFKLSSFDSSIFSHAKMYLDWLKRNRFCAGCGKPTIPIFAGSKLLCSSDKEVDKCPVKNASVSNISFPRTDSVIITAITDRSYSKLLLGRGKRFPLPMYSCIAGFIEPSETIEVASLREVWEETGVKASELQIIKSQPWPYPSNLMIGCIAIVELNGFNEVIDLGHDPELLDAKWFNTSDIKKMINETNLTSPDGSWFLPPSNAIAYHLIEHVVKKYDELNK